MKEIAEIKHDDPFEGKNIVGVVCLQNMMKCIILNQIVDFLNGN